MAVKIWTGASSEDVNTAGNWTGGVPVDADTVVIQGTVSMTGSLTALQGVTVGSITVVPDYGGKIGSASAALLFGACTGTLKYAGKGEYAKIGFTTDGAESGICAQAELNHTGGVFYVSTGTGGVWTTVRNGPGTLYVDAGAVVTNLYNGSGRLDVLYNATALTILENAGSAFVNRAITTLKAVQGRTIHRNNGTANYLSVTTAEVMGGAVYNKQSGGNDTTWKVYPRGTITTEGNQGNATAGAEITTTTLFEWPGSQINTAAAPGITVTITTRLPVGQGAGGGSPTS